MRLATTITDGHRRSSTARDRLGEGPRAGGAGALARGCRCGTGAASSGRSSRIGRRPAQACAGTRQEPRAPWRLSDPGRKAILDRLGGLQAHCGNPRVPAASVRRRDSVAARVMVAASPPGLPTRLPRCATRSPAAQTATKSEASAIAPTGGRVRRSRSRFARGDTSVVRRSPCCSQWLRVTQHPGLVLTRRLASGACRHRARVMPRLDMLLGGDILLGRIGPEGE